MPDLTYPIEILLKEADKMNNGLKTLGSDVNAQYHLQKISQIFNAIELLQIEHLKGRK